MPNFLKKIWLRGRIEPISDREWIVGEFRKSAKNVKQSDQAAQAAFSIILATYWKAFIAEHGSPGNYARLPHDEQMAYYKKWLLLCGEIDMLNDKESLIPAQIISYYLATVVNKDREFEIEIAQFCDEYASKGWNFV